MYFFFGNLLSRFTIKPVSLKMPLNQSRDQKLKERWEKLVAVLSDRFSDGEALDVEGRGQNFL